MQLNNSIAAAVLAFSDRVAGRQYVQHFGVTASAREPILTTITTDVGFPFSKSTGVLQNPVALQTEICEAVTSSICFMVDITQPATSTATPSSVVVTDVYTPVVTDGTTTGVSATSSDVQTPTATTGVETTSVVTPSSAAGAKGDADAAGILAGLALFLVI